MLTWLLDFRQLVTLFLHFPMLAVAQCGLAVKPRAHFLPHHTLTHLQTLMYICVCVPRTCRGRRILSPAAMLIIWWRRTTSGVKYCLTRPHTHSGTHKIHPLIHTTTEPTHSHTLTQRQSYANQKNIVTRLKWKRNSWKTFHVALSLRTIWTAPTATPTPTRTPMPRLMPPSLRSLRTVAHNFVAA